MRESLKIFKALCDETRFKIVESLLNGEKCVCEIVPLTKRTQSTVSIQLAKLEGLGIVESRREGKSVYYKIVNLKVKKILSKIDSNEWHEINRTKIKWYPIIDESKCIGCGMCILTCERNVFEYDNKKNKSKVMNPFNCMVGCDLCSVYCPTEAISLTQKSRRKFIQSLLKKHKIITKTKEKFLKNIKRC